MVVSTWGQNTGVALVTVCTHYDFQRHGCPLLRLFPPGRLTKQEGTGVYAASASNAFLVSPNIFSYVESVTGIESAGKQPAPSYRRTGNIQDRVQYGFDFLGIRLLA